MKNIKIENDKFIIYFKNKYYVVNEYTKQLFEALTKSGNVKDFCSLLQLKERKGTKLLSKLNKKLNTCNYYDTNISLPVPLKIQWKMTNVCNLKCSHCYLGKLSNTCLSEDKLLTIAKRIIDLGIMEVTLTGGEVFTIKCIEKIIRLFLDNDVRINIFTNGTLIDKHLAFLKSVEDKDLIHFMISLDGTKQAHDAIRGTGTYEKTMKNIESIVAMDYKITVNMVLTKLNYKTLYKLVGELTKRNVYRLQLSELIISGNATEEMKLTQKDSQEIRDIFESINRDYKGINVYYSGESDDVPDEIFLLTEKTLHSLGSQKWKCGAGLGRATINPNGDVVCCPFIGKYVLGNILEKDLKEIWDNEKRYEFLRFLATKNDGGRKCFVARGDF